MLMLPLESERRHRGQTKPNEVEKLNSSTLKLAETQKVSESFLLIDTLFCFVKILKRI